MTKRTETETGIVLSDTAARRGVVKAYRCHPAVDGKLVTVQAETSFKATAMYATAFGVEPVNVFKQWSL